MKSSKSVLFSSLAVLLFFAVCGLSISPPPVAAETNIANGRQFTCVGTTIISVRSGLAVSKRKVLKKFNSVIEQQDANIASSSPGSRARKKAVRIRRNAVQGRRDARACAKGELDSSFVGQWNLTLENGMTPAENGYNSLTLSFSASDFISEFDGNVFDCHWEGTYSPSMDGETVSLLTQIGTGNAFCTIAIGQNRTAQVEFSEDQNTLTLDYRPDGALQVYERVG